MNDPNDLIPPPVIVRQQLARNIRERRLLRGLLKLSIRAAEPMIPPPGPGADRHEPGRIRAACA